MGSGTLRALVQFVSWFRWGHITSPIAGRPDRPIQIEKKYLNCVKRRLKVQPCTVLFLSNFGHMQYAVIVLLLSILSFMAEGITNKTKVRLKSRQLASICQVEQTRQFSFFQGPIVKSNNNNKHHFRLRHGREQRNVFSCGRGQPSTHQQWISTYLITIGRQVGTYQTFKRMKKFITLHLCILQMQQGAYNGMEYVLHMYTAYLEVKIERKDLTQGLELLLRYLH